MRVQRKGAREMKELNVKPVFNPKPIVTTCPPRGHRIRVCVVKAGAVINIYG